MKDEIINIIISLIILLGICYFIFQTDVINKNINTNSNKTVKTELNNNLQSETEINNKIDDWRLMLVNYENELPKNYKIELANIDDTRQFDKRAINKLFELQKAMKKDGIRDIWVQSSYRSIEQQQKVYDKKIDEYIKSGKTHKEAEELTLKVINKPGTSEHNLGLAVDFNYVNLEFENTKAFKWLKENAESYGFILRYKKEKEGITKVNYEPWHWRYVGKEHAKKINELDLCLEEYIEYLKEIRE